MDARAYESVTVKEYDASSGEVTIEDNLKSYHFGAD
jgi:hypothetical protein